MSLKELASEKFLWFLVLFYVSVFISGFLSNMAAGALGETGVLASVVLLVLPAAVAYIVFKRFRRKWD